jgi:hypothetical protein
VVNSVEWVFAGFLIASIVHITEEYVYPGGFPTVMKRTAPRFAPLITTRFAVIINGLQLILCVVAIIVGQRNLVFSLSVAGLLMVNGLAHIGASIRRRGYAPGVLSGLVLYLPLSLYAYASFITAGQLTASEVLVTGVLGTLYQAVPLSYLAVASAVKRA